MCQLYIIEEKAKIASEEQAFERSLEVEFQEGQYE